MGTNYYSINGRPERFSGDRLKKKSSAPDVDVYAVDDTLKTAVSKYRDVFARHGDPQKLPRTLNAVVSYILTDNAPKRIFQTRPHPSGGNVTSLDKMQEYWLLWSIKDGVLYLHNILMRGK